jgi:L-2,4-diaminobutyrate decarboxylase
MEDIESAIKRVKSLYDPAVFKTAADSVSRGLHSYFEDAISSNRTRHWKEPIDTLKIAKDLLSDPLTKFDKNKFNLTEEAADKVVNTFLTNAHNLHSPNYMGHQVPPPIVASGPFDLLGAATNQGAGLYEMGPMSAMAERAVAHKMMAMIGFDENKGAFIGTSGGSLANLTAVLAARNRKYKDFWKKGALSSELNGRVPAVVTSQESHYSISRAVGILGLGTDQVLTVPVDSKRRMDPKALENILDKAERENFDVFCIVGTAGTTPTGAFDPLREIGVIANKRKIWFHVDGAHGASVLFSAQYRNFTDGIELADSVTWDAHKLLFVPSLSTFLFFKEKASSHTAFQQDAPYLRTDRSEDYDSITRTVECTKRSLALSLWSMWSIYGPSVFEDLVNVAFYQTRTFYRMLKESSDFVPLHEPQCNILCFKYLPDHLKSESASKISEVQQVIREKLLHSGEFYTTATRLDGSFCLRITLINPTTEEIHFRGLMDTIRKIEKT